MLWDVLRQTDFAGRFDKLKDKSKRLPLYRDGHLRQIDEAAWPMMLWTKGSKQGEVMVEGKYRKVVPGWERKAVAIRLTF